jgi:hypothetical protein
MGGAQTGVRQRRHLTQMLSGVDGLYTFSPSLCNQSVRVIRILVNSHVDLCSLSSTRVPRLSSAPVVVDDDRRASWAASCVVGGALASIRRHHASWIASCVPSCVVDGIVCRASWTAPCVPSCVVDAIHDCVCSRGDDTHTNVRRV